MYSYFMVQHNLNIASVNWRQPGNVLGPTCQDAALDSAPRCGVFMPDHPPAQQSLIDVRDHEASRRRMRRSAWKASYAGHEAHEKGTANSTLTPGTASGTGAEQQSWSPQGHPALGQQLPPSPPSLPAPKDINSVLKTSGGKPRSENHGWRQTVHVCHVTITS